MWAEEGGSGLSYHVTLSGAEGKAQLCVDTREEADVQCGGHVDNTGWDLLGSGLRQGVVPLPPSG